VHFLILKETLNQFTMRGRNNMKAVGHVCDHLVWNVWKKQYC